MSLPATAGEVIEIAREVLHLAPSAFPPDLAKSEIAGQPEWYPFETACWKLGEVIRQKLLRSPRLRGDPRVVSAILEVIEQRSLRRGRQSFVMLLGAVKFAHTAPRVARLAGDPDIDGHVVDTLLKMRVPGYVEVIEPHLSSKFAWIRRKAKTYVERYAA
jgi:hypothetical protein